MIKLVVEAKEPVYAELGAEPTGYQVSFGPDRDEDNSAWVPAGANPSLSASVIMNPEAAASYNVGDAVYLPGKGEVVDLDGDVGPLGDRADLENADDTGGDAVLHPDTTDAEQKAQAAVPGAGAVHRRRQDRRRGDHRGRYGRRPQGQARQGVA